MRERNKNCTKLIITCIISIELIFKLSQKHAHSTNSKGEKDL